MYGKDIERMLKSTNKIKKFIEDGVDSLTRAMSGRLSVDEYRQEVASPYSGSFSALMSSLDDIESDCDKMKKMDNQNYCDKTEINNSIGSPWTEFARLKTGIQDLSSYYDAHPSLQYLGEKTAMCLLMNTVLTLVIDAKWALITYHDYTQRGFDNLYNDNTPSITFTKDVQGNQTTGNITQANDDNVHVKQPSTDPY